MPAVATVPARRPDGTSFWKALPSDLLAHLDRHGEEKSFRKGDTLYVEGDGAQSMWILKTGRVHAVKTLPNGAVMTVCRIDAGGLFGLCCGLHNRQYVCQAVAATDVTAVKVPVALFLQWVEGDPGVSRAYLETLATRLREAQWMRSVGQEPVEQRIATVVLSLTREHGSSLPFTRREIGEMVGTTVESAVRALSGFEKKGWIRSTRGCITIVHADPLQALAAAS